MKFAFITPRYGAEITSGAEHACRLLAEQICHRHDVDVLTTCARDTRRARADYPEGADRVRGVLVRRFALSQPYDAPEHLRPFTERLLSGPRSHAEELEWVRRLGPWSPALVEYLKRQHRTYDALVFFSLWHPSTVHGIHVAPERSVLFPYLQLRPALRFALWADVLSAPRALGFFSSSERRLARAYVRATPQHEEIVGIGVDPPPHQSYPRHQQDPADTVVDDDAWPRPADDEAGEAYLEGRGIPFRRRHRLYGRFVLYGGRIDGDNGSEEMLEYFDSYAQTDGAAPLVLMGAKMMKTPDEPYLHLAGVLPDRERMIAYEAADLTIAPAPDDLLSQTLLESLSVGTPVLASARNEAAVEHCRKAGGGLYYADRDEFVEALRVLMSNQKLRDRLAASGRGYIQQQHRWDAVIGRFDRLISRVKGR